MLFILENLQITKSHISANALYFSTLRQKQNVNRGKKCCAKQSLYGYVAHYGLTILWYTDVESKYVYLIQNVRYNFKQGIELRAWEIKYISDEHTTVIYSLKPLS